MSAGATLPSLCRGVGVGGPTRQGRGLAGHKCSYLTYSPFPFLPSARLTLPSGGSESGRSTPSLSVLSDSKPPPCTYQQAPRHFHVPGRHPGRAVGLAMQSVCLHGRAVVPKPLRPPPPNLWVCTPRSWLVFELLPKPCKHQGDVFALLETCWREGAVRPAVHLSRLPPSAPWTRFWHRAGRRLACGVGPGHQSPVGHQILSGHLGSGA